MTEMLKTSPHFKCRKKPLSWPVSRMKTLHYKNTWLWPMKKSVHCSVVVSPVSKQVNGRNFFGKKFRNKENIIELFCKNHSLSLSSHTAALVVHFLQEKLKTLGSVLRGVRRIQDTGQFPLLHTEICKKFLNNSSGWQRQLVRMWGRFTNP